jgi:hypothetical protein
MVKPSEIIQKCYEQSFYLGSKLSNLECIGYSERAGGALCFILSGGTYAVIGVPGTQNISDVFRDINILPTSEASICSGLVVHSGFNDTTTDNGFAADMSALTYSTATLSQVIPGAVWLGSSGSLGLSSFTKIYLTGHSLGASIATIVSARMSTMIGYSSTYTKLITYGCPNVLRGRCSVDAANIIHTSKVSFGYLGFKLYNDVVTTIPPFYHRLGEDVPMGHASLSGLEMYGYVAASMLAHQISAYVSIDPMDL